MLSHCCPFKGSKKSSSKIDGNQIIFGAIDFQPHPPTIAPVFANMDQEMDLTIGSFTFHIGSLGTVRLSDPVNLGLSVGKTAITVTLETLVGSSSEVNSLVSIKPMKNKGNIIKELDKIMENLNLEESSDYSDMASDENLDNSNYSGEDFMIRYGNVSNKSTYTWKIGQELYDNEQTILSGFSSGINN
jgi:hypothetical protein